MLRLSKTVPRLQAECQRSPSDVFRDVKLRGTPDTLGSPAANQTIGHKNPEREERNARIREMFANGEPVKNIAKKEGLTTFRVYGICRGVERKVKPTRAKNPEMERRNAIIRKRFANGETQKEIGEDFGLTQQAVGKICKGVEREECSDLEIEARNARIRERFANGETQKNIANEEGLSAMHVYRICKGVERKVKPKEERDARIRERYANGETQRAIGKDYDLVKSVISSICKGIKRKSGFRYLSGPEVKERNISIRERFANGETAKKIAKMEGLSVRHVYFICRGVEQKGKPLRKPWLENPEIKKRIARIRERYANGETGKRIAREEGLTRDYIYHICLGIHHRNGLREERKK